MLVDNSTSVSASASSSSNIVLEDIFTIVEIDRDGKKFDRVSRLHCVSDNFKLDALLDVNTELFPLHQKQDRMTLVLARSLQLENTTKSLADDYDYVMYGKVYKFDENRATSATSGSSGKNKM
ncbi:hypothetical protein MP638_001110 [Amoeboaphelidium occidentale]|nr:hypothetical protein MP638_001110 [Amoeboaphelidium occidentale]